MVTSIERIIKRFYSQEHNLFDWKCLSLNPAITDDFIAKTFTEYPWAKHIIGRRASLELILELKGEIEPHHLIHNSKVTRSFVEKNFDKEFLEKFIFTKRKDLVHGVNHDDIYYPPKRYVNRTIKKPDSFYITHSMLVYFLHSLKLVELSDKDAEAYEKEAFMNSWIPYPEFEDIVTPEEVQKTIEGNFEFVSKNYIKMFVDFFNTNNVKEHVFWFSIAEYLNYDFLVEHRELFTREEVNFLRIFTLKDVEKEPSFGWNMEMWSGVTGLDVDFVLNYPKLHWSFLLFSSNTFGEEP